MTKHNLEPHSIEAEQAVLGSCLIDRDAVLHVAGHLSPADFYRAGHAVIYRAIWNLFNRRVPADLVAVVDEMSRTGDLERAGGESYLAELVQATPTSVHVIYYRDIVSEHALRRRIIQAAQDIVATGYDTTKSIPDAISDAEAALQKATQRTDMRDIDRMPDVVDRYLTTMHEGRGRLTSLGYRPLDQIIGGIEDGDLAIVAARPSMGKTAFALGSGRHVARDLGRRVLFLSLEMSSEKLLHRLLSMETGIDSRKIGFRGMALGDEEEWMVREAGKVIADWPLDFDSPASGRVEMALTRARNYSYQYGLDLLIVDGLWLLEWAAAKGDRTREVGKISRMLKLFAMEMSIPVIALHQLNRASLGRSDHTPVLSDLRESGDVEQDADLVVFIHRPGLLDHKTDRAVSQIIVAKNRQGPIGKVTMVFDERSTRFREFHNSEMAAD